jgi:mono/diheme cytochrome c family protein
MRLCPGFLLLSLGLVVLHPATGWTAEQPSKTEKSAFSKEIAPLLKTYCTRCHGGARPRGGIVLEGDRDENTIRKERNVWERVAHAVRAGEMPPASRKQPTKEEVQRLASWVEKVLGSGDCTVNKNPGRVTLRRLNRVEYNNTIRDLLGVKFEPAEDFPADDVGYGFDNIGDVLSLPPLLMEKYMAAAEKIVTMALAAPQIRKRIYIVQPTDKNKDECARKILDNFARKAYRRAVRPEEVERLITRFVKEAEAQGDSFDKGIELALEAILTSPHFLFRVERDNWTRRGDGTNPVNEYELASRLSYFLWSSMPDDELLTLAQQGELRKNANLEAQVRRMLRDGKSGALVENFAGQWLQLRNLRNMTPDPGQFPTFDESLRSAMLQETEQFFAAIMNEDRSVLEFLDADFTFLNERLAKHYGIAGVKGEQFRRVKLSGVPRGGVLTQASILTLTSNPTRTSPVKRGKWILENILGTPPPPPPPGAGELSEDKKVVLSGTLRQRMEQHRANPNCAVCHQRLDPLGFGFENFDAIGAWRERDGKFPIDSSGTLPSGQSFKGPVELKAILKKQQDAFGRCLAEKMLTYAVGRGLEPYDRCVVDQIAAELARNQYKFSSLVSEIVRSDPFQKRRATRGDR